jgi:adenine phosphoribosyltransferase
MADSRVDAVRALIRDVPDFPKPGIVFKDITPMLADARAFAACVDLLAEAIAPRKPDALIGIESRGFIFAAPVARALGVGFVPVRKPGKLPHRTRRVEYALEYGTDALEMHHDALVRDARVIIVDDVLATGGTAAAAGRLVEEAGGRLAGFAFAIELAFLSGRTRLAGYTVDALISY